MAKDLFAQGQGLLLNAKAKDLTLKAKAKDDLQGQDQGLKICPRGRLKAKDQGQGQQHWLYLTNVLSWLLNCFFLTHLWSINPIMSITDAALLPVQLIAYVAHKEIKYSNK